MSRAALEIGLRAIAGCGLRSETVSSCGARMPVSTRMAASELAAYFDDEVESERRERGKHGAPENARVEDQDQHRVFPTWARRVLVGVGERRPGLAQVPDR